MNEQNLKRIINERLEHGRNLRESTTLIKCLAIVEFDDGTNWQEMLAHIPPEAIDSEGYVEEVWIAPEEISIDENRSQWRGAFTFISWLAFRLKHCKNRKVCGV